MEIPGIFFKIIGSPWDFLAMAWTRPVQNWAEAQFGRRGKLRCHRIDELLKPNWPPRTLPEPQETPQTPQGGFNKISNFLKIFVTSSQSAGNLLARHPLSLRSSG